MSNQKLEGAIAGRYGPPLYPPKLEAIQRYYETRRHRTHPMTEERLRHYADDLKLIVFRGSEVKFNPDFVTEDGTRWIATSFRSTNGDKYILAFPKDEDPKHHDGTVSAQHVALYCKDDEVDEDELNKVAHAAYAIFYTFSGH